MYELIPLGGIQEIGKNMWVVSNGEQYLIIDIGLKFPSEDMLGVNHLLPKFDFVLENQSKLAGIVLTHAHEDHVGGLVPFLTALEKHVPIYATELTLGLLEDRIIEVDTEYKKYLQKVEGRTRCKVGSFDVEFLHVCHSISGALGLAIHTPEGAIIFTGDFKMDPTPIDQLPTDYYKFAELGEQGVLALIADSTNAAKPGYTISEKEVAQNFVNAFYRAKGRIIIATFSSSLHRIQQLVNRCAEFNRKVCFMGRSMVRVTDKAHELGFLTYPPDCVVSSENIDSYPDHEVCIITTGSQGEPMAVLSLMAKGRYRQISIEDGDTVILSANVIPGNEKSIYENINRLMERGAKVVYESSKGLHASGHASQEELKLMLNLTRPKYFVPTHGDYHKMSCHADLARQTGVEDDNIFLMYIGDRLILDPKQARLGDKVPAGVVMVAGRGLGYLDPKELKERHKLVKDGVVFLSCSVSDKGVLLSTPMVTSKGYVIQDGPEELYSAAARFIEGAWEKQVLKNGWDKDSMKNRLRELLSRYLYSETKRRPQIITQIHFVGDNDD